MTRTMIIATFAATALTLATANAQTVSDGRLKQAKVIIEHNATDNDTGFQAFVDADGWEKLEVIGPNGTIADFQPKGSVTDLGMTELFLETVEPENAKMPLTDLLKKLPAGNYEFRATASKLGGNSGTMVGTAKLSHQIPQGVTLIEPKEESVIPIADTLVKWQGTDKAIDGSKVNIIAYQLIIEKDEEPHPRMIGKRGLSMYLPATVNEIEISKMFFEPATSYLWEVLAIADSGNQTLQSGAFKTQ